jgi:SAM-dependent methyltransferase
MTPTTQTTKPVAPTEADPKAVEAFTGKVFEDFATTTSTLLAAIGDQYGLFADMAACGPQTAKELAAHTKTSERYVGEWLKALASAGYVKRDPTNDTYTLPPEHVPVLAKNGTPFSLSGFFPQIRSIVRIYDEIATAFRTGKGVNPAYYDEDFHDGQAQFTQFWFDQLLVQQWIPASKGLREKLEAGASVADLGCGQGRLLITLAKAFPKSSFVGFDVNPAVIKKAARNAKEAGVSDRVRFEQRDILKGLGDQFDLITIVDALHDMPDPIAVAKVARKALRQGGTFLLQDPLGGETVEENAGPKGKLLYSAGVLYCLSVGLHGDKGPGAGPLGIPASQLRKIATAAGFKTVNRLAWEDPMSALHEFRA